MPGHGPADAAYLQADVLAWPWFVSLSLPGHPGAAPGPGSPHGACLAYLTWAQLSASPRSAPGSPPLREQSALTTP